MSLGEVDYGLLGLIGGLTVFISFINSLFAGAIGRYYALTVGKEAAACEEGLSECRMWFTTAVVIHTVIPVILMLIGYPVGEWAVRHYLTIPPDRIEACVWVFRFVCCTCFLGMVSVPLQAMYSAKQYIAELTIYSFVTTTLNAFFLYYMVTHPGVWLTRLAFWQMLLGLAPSLIISIRAYFIFPECRIVPRHLCCFKKIKLLGGYVGWTALGALGSMLQGQGIAIVINKYFGPTFNAGAAVGNTLSGHCQTLAGSMNGAFSPAIYNAWGAGEYATARRLAFRICKLGVLFTLIFAIPLAIEVDTVLVLWLKNPPPFAALMCLFVLAANVIDRTTVGHMYCVLANGRIGWYHIFLGGALLMTIPVAILFLSFGWGMHAIGWALVSMTGLCAFGRVWFARWLAGMSSIYWLKKIMMPLIALGVTTLFVGMMPRFFMPSGFLRICLTTACVEIWMLPAAWRIVLDTDERRYLQEKILSFVRRRLEVAR